MTEPGTDLTGSRSYRSSMAHPLRSSGPANLADILERVLDKGIVIAGDIRVNLLDIELLTIKIRLLVASVDKAEEEYYDPGRIRAQLDEVERQRAEGSLSDEEAEALEEELVERLIEGQRRFREE